MNKVIYNKKSKVNSHITNEQLKNSDIYVISRNEIEYFKEHYNNYKPYKIIYLDAPEAICRNHMKQCKYDNEDIQKQMINDRLEFEGIENLADIVIPNKYFLSTVCDVWEYIRNCEVDYRKKLNKNKKA